MDGAEKKIFDIMQSKNQKGYTPIKDVLVESLSFPSQVLQQLKLIQSHVIQLFYNLILQIQ